MKRRASSRLIVLTLAAGLLLPFSSYATSNRPDPKEFQAIEVKARRVDQVALQSQDAAARRLTALIQKYRGRAQESALLMRLAQVYQEGAGIEFRISTHGAASGTKLERYRTRLNYAIRTVNDLLGRFPNFPMVDQALFIRAKAKEELEQKKEAKQDYLLLTTHFPTSQHAIASYMALADLVTADNKYAEAISYLRKIEAEPESPQYPFALYKLAWANFNMTLISKSLNYLAMHIRYIDKAQEGRKNLRASDIALRENSLQDVSTFYFEGLERNLSDSSITYSVDKALGYFENLKPGPVLGRMSLRFAKLLRSRRKEDELVKWKNIMIKEEAKLPESMEVVMTLLDHQWDMYHYSEFAIALKDLQKLYQEQKAEIRSNTAYETTYRETLDSLAQKAEKLQTSVIAEISKNPGQRSSEIQTKMKTLGELYTTMINIVPESDPKVGFAHYNLAETLFKISDYAQATDHYRWLLSHWSSKNYSAKFSKDDVALKAIASRYEALRAQKLVPEKLAPAPLDQTQWASFKKRLPVLMSEWIDWIDDYSGKADESFANFEFEANRMVYAQGGIQAAIERLTEFSEKLPNSKYAVPSRELVLDSYIITKNWKETLKIANLFQRTAVKGTPFEQKLTQLAADCSYKLLEERYSLATKLQKNAKDGSAEEKAEFAKVSRDFKDQAQSYLKLFPGNARSADVLFLLATSEQAAGDAKAVKNHLTDLIAHHPSSSLKSKALLARSKIESDDYQWGQAAADLEAYISGLGPSEKLSSDNSERSQLLFLKWMSKGSPSSYCKAQGSGVSECPRYMALASLKDGASEGATKYKTVRELALKGPAENRAIWALAALKWNEEIPLRDELLLVRAISQNWEKLDSVARVTTLGDLNSVIPKALAQARMEIRKANPMHRPSPKAVTIRAEWIKELEETVSKVQKLPWYRVQSSSMMQLAEAYDEFVENLLGAAVPKDLTPEDRAQYTKNIDDLVKPFSQKRDDIAEHAIRIAFQAAIEEGDRKNIIKRFPTLASRIGKEFQSKFAKKNAQNPQSASAETALISALVWKIESASSGGAVNQWKDTYRTGSWAQNAVLLQEIASKKALPEFQIKVLRSAMLAANGAQAEALIELQGALTEMPANGAFRRDVMGMLFSHYYRAGSLDAALQLAELIQKERGTLL